MKRFIFHPSSFILCLLLALPAFADFSGLPDGVKANLSTIKRYPKSSAILLWVKDSYTQAESREQVYERHEFRYLPDEAARDIWGDPHIAYEDGRQKIDIITARAYTSDGRTIDATPNNAFNPVTPEALDHAPDFSQFRQMVVTLLGLENGSIAELHYKLTTEKPLYPWLWGRVYFREEVPTIAHELSVILPAGRGLNYVVCNGLPAPLVTGSTYVWRMDEQSGYAAEDLRDHRVLLPNVAFTTAKNWPEVTSELLKRVEAASDGFDVPKSLQQKLAGALEPESTLDSIKAWVRERYNEIEFDHPDFVVSIRPESQVLNSGYGHSLEMAVLVSSLCSRAGVTAQPEAWFAFEPPVPYLYDLTGGLVMAATETGRNEGDPLAPGDEFPASALADATILSLAAESNAPRRTPNDVNFGEVRISLNLDALDADTIHGSGSLFADGLHTPYEALQTDPKAHIEHLISWSGFEVTGVIVKRLDPTSAAVNFSFTLPHPDTVDNFYVLSANAMDLSQFAGNPTLSLERKEFPHYVKLPGKISVHVETPLPDGWIVTQQPAALTRAWKDGSGFRAVTVSDRRVMVDETLTLGSPWLPPQDWGEFRSFLLETGSRPANIIVFADKPN